MKCIEDEIPFEVPTGWAWTRLASICLKVTDGTHHSPDNFPSGEFKYITAKNIKLNGITLDDITYVTPDVHKEIFARCNPEFGDILYIKDGATSGIATVNNLYEEFSMLSSVALLKPAHSIDNWYMCYVMQSPYFYSTTRGDMKGVGITRITLNMLSSRLIPIPSRKEQRQIAIKTKETINLISCVESDRDNILKIISNAKARILDFAIRGKLVPQDPNDEPASALLERIRAEKEELIKQGKIKRDKKESIIFRGDDNSYYRNMNNKNLCIDSELPFVLPDNWSWCTLGDICSVFGRIGFRGYTKNDLVSLQEGAITLSPSNIINNRMDYTNCTYISWFKYEESPEIQIANGDILLVKTGSSYGKSALVENLPYAATINPQFVVLKKIHINSRYLCCVLQSTYARGIFDELVVGTAIPTFTQEKLNSMYIPIPSLNEQQHIADCVYKIFKQFDLITNVIL